MGNLEKFYNFFYKEGFGVKVFFYVIFSIRFGEFRRKRFFVGKYLGNKFFFDTFGERNDKIIEIVGDLEKYIVIDDDYIYLDLNIDDKVRFEFFRRL